MKQLAEQYAGRAEFLFVYSQEVHTAPPAPAGVDGKYVRAGRPVRQAATAAERRQAAALIRPDVEPARRLLLDGFGPDSLFDRLFPQFGNPVVVVGGDGRVALVKKWTRADEVQRSLRRLLGEPGGRSRPEGGKPLPRPVGIPTVRGGGAPHPLGPGAAGPATAAAAPRFRA
jgi:hypothetical protein